jgi:hypothetical protein
MDYRLTKSKYIKGLQCPKALYLDTYKNYLSKISEETKTKFKQGRNFEAKFKSDFPDGVALDKQLGRQINKYSSTTKLLLDNDSVTIFEAGFIYDETLVLTDVVSKDETGTTVYEIKNALNLTDVIFQDMSVQYFVCKSNLGSIKSFNVVLNDGNDGFKIIDVTDKLRDNEEFVRQKISDFKKILQLTDEPQISTGKQCDFPYECEFKHYCSERKQKQVNPTNIDGIELDLANEEFNTAVEFIQQTNKFVYLTGKAGTGKTTFLKYIKATTNKSAVILAPTGVAAINAGGQTIHSFFNIKPGVYVPGDKRLKTKHENNTDNYTIFDYFKYSKEKQSIIKGLELLIIDEISMVRCDLLDVIDKLLRVFRKRENESFGGVQVILIGDTFQLPPIADFDQWEILKTFYESPFFFSSKAIKNNNPIYIELKKIYRQNEWKFIDLLNKIRVNQVNRTDLDLLNSKYDPLFSPPKEDKYIILATHNAIVDKTNLQKLKELQGISKNFEAAVTGIFPENIMPTGRILQLKTGAQIMFIKNDKSKKYYNGKIAEIISFNKSEIIVKSGKEIISVEKQQWDNIKYTWNQKENKIEEEIIGSFIQYPVKLAWAITVHKSQGLTFERVIADLSAAFAPGQVYVALSRCTTFNGLILKTKISEKVIITAPEVLEFAQKETSETLIVNELNSGKANFYYKKVRDALKQLKFDEAYNNLMIAIKYRNDTETGEFKRYFNLFASRLADYKYKYNQVKDVLKKSDTENVSLREKIEKVSEQNNSVKLRNKVKKLENLISSQTTAIEQLENQNKILKEDMEQANSVIKEQEDRINSLEHNIIKINKVKWYHKLIGKR